MRKKNNFNFFYFDLDGVIFDSKKNMKKSWKDVCIKHNIDIKFKKYFDKIGKPFEQILINLGLDPNKKFLRLFNHRQLKILI